MATGPECLKRLGAIEIIAVNSLCTFLAVLPFKISVLARAAIHHKRDGVTFRQIVAWFAGITVMGLADRVAEGIRSNAGELLA